MRRLFLLSAIAVGALCTLIGSVPAKTELVKKGVQTRIAAWDCFGIYCSRGICVTLENASDRQPGRARFYIEGLWGDPRDLDEHTGKYCVEKSGIGYVLFTVLVTPTSDDVYATTADDLR